MIKVVKINANNKPGMIPATNSLAIDSSANVPRIMTNTDGGTMGARLAPAHVAAALAASRKVSGGAA